MEKHIEEQLAGRKPEEVEELNIDNCNVSQISGLTDEYVNLETLTLANNGLTSLKGFPNLPNLRKLDLSDNQLADGLELLHTSPNLEFLNLSGNLFKDISGLEPLKKLKQLQSLEVFSCELADTEDYRARLFELLEDVLFIDGLDRDGQPAPNDDDDEPEDEGDEDASEEDEVESDEAGEGREGPDEEDDEGSEDNEDASRGTKRKHEDEDDDA